MIRRFDVDEFEYDGDPNGVIDAPLNSQCTDLSAPRIWYKTTGSGIKTGWISRNSTQEGGNWEFVDGDRAIVPADFGKTLVVRNNDGNINFTFPDTDSPATVDIVLLYTAADYITASAASGASFSQMTGKKITQANVIFRFLANATGTWTTTAPLVNV